MYKNKKHTSSYNTSTYQHDEFSSILFRGVEWVFYPTTLLAQCDSCIGSKTSINLNDKKNLLGTFFPPARVNIDINFL